MSSSELDLNEHHHGLLLNYLRFAKFQRGQCLKSIQGEFDDAKQVRLLDETYTVDEIVDILSDISQLVSGEIESELINSAHTNVLLLSQVFQQAQKWHLNLEADLAELENRELLNKVKRWEDNELSSMHGQEKPNLSLGGSSKKLLAPLNDGGPAQLLQLQITQLTEENVRLKDRLKGLESQATKVLGEKDQMKKQLEEGEEERRKEKQAEQPQDLKEVDELSDALQCLKHEMATEKQFSAKSQKELEGNLTDTKHNLLEVQHQLSMAEKELEKKFSQTGAFKNLKKMLSAKNDQIKELRQKLRQLDGGDEEEEE